jgi:uncharacterized protein YkwD
MLEVLLTSNTGDSMNPAFRNLLLWLAMFGLAGYGAVRLACSSAGESDTHEAVPTSAEAAPRPSSKAAAAPELAAPAPQAEPSEAGHSVSVAVSAEDPLKPDAPLIIPADVEDAWPAEWARWEEEVLKLVNARRAEGAVCGGKKMASAPPLARNEKLQRAARRHSIDMRKNNFMSHTSSDGRSPLDRTHAEGYVGMGGGENVARSYEPQRVMQRWMSSPGHCKNIMEPKFTDLGVGFVAPNSWTQNFGQGL